MKKEITTLILLFLFTVSTAQTIKDIKNIQDISSVDEIKEYINKAKSQGISLNEAKQILQSQGASSVQLNLISDIWDTDFLKEDIKFEDSQPIKIESKFGLDVKKTFKESLRFGSSFFNNPNISESPQLFLATPEDYRLGPGDELTISLYGASENTYNATISREGNIKIDRIPPVYLSGLSLKQAKLKLVKSLSKIYVGLNSNNEINRVGFDLSLRKARSIVVNIVGNVSAPGTYTIPAFSSVLNALYSAGGPNEIGSYRNIKILRSGKNINNIDLYEYFSSGMYPELYLRDQDVIFVPTLSKEVLVTNGFRLNGKFEMLDNETFEDLINFTGGFESNSYRDKIFLERTSDLKINFFEIKKENYPTLIPSDGDFISAKFPNDFVEDRVSVNGEVLLPGDFSLKNNRTLNDLIKSSGGFTRNALLNRAILKRTNNGIQNEIISLDLSLKENLETNLQVLDSLFIPNRTKIIPIDKIRILGGINGDELIDYRKNMTVIDALILSGGYKVDTDLENIKVYRNITINGSNIISETFNSSISKDLNVINNILLEPKDIIVLKPKKFLSELEYYNVQGEVATNGDFIIDKENLSVSDILDNIEFKVSASIKDIYLKRDSISVPLYDKNMNILSLNIKKNDSIIVPRIDNTIKIEGEVHNPIIIPFRKGITFSDLISYAGGFKKSADKKRVYVVSRNGQSKISKTFIFRFYPKISSGDRIYVPEKVDIERKTSLGEVIGLSSSVVSLATLIQILSK